MKNQRIEEAQAPFVRVRSASIVKQMETLNKEMTVTLRGGMNAMNIPRQLTVFGC